MIAIEDWIHSNELLSIRGVWMLIGMVMASALFWIVNRKVLKMQAAASENLANTLSRQIEAIEKERNDYRTKLHDERDAHQACELRNKELEAQPNLTTLTLLLQDQKSWMQSLGGALAEHAESDAKIFTKIEQSLSKLVERAGG